MGAHTDVNPIIVSIVVVPERLAMPIRQIAQAELYLPLGVEHFRNGDAELKDVCLWPAVPRLHVRTAHVSVALPGIKRDAHPHVLAEANVPDARRAPQNVPRLRQHGAAVQRHHAPGQLVAEGPEVCGWLREAQLKPGAGAAGADRAAVAVLLRLDGRGGGGSQ